MSEFFLHFIFSQKILCEIRVNLMEKYYLCALKFFHYDNTEKT